MEQHHQDKSRHVTSKVSRPSTATSRDGSSTSSIGGSAGASGSECGLTGSRPGTRFGLVSHDTAGDAQKRLLDSKRAERLANLLVDDEEVLQNSKTVMLRAPQLPTTKAREEEEDTEAFIQEDDDDDDTLQDDVSSRVSSALARRRFNATGTAGAPATSVGGTQLPTDASSILSSMRATAPRQRPQTAGSVRVVSFQPSLRQNSETVDDDNNDTDENSCVAALADPAMGSQVHTTMSSRGAPRASYDRPLSAMAIKANAALTVAAAQERQAQAHIVRQERNADLEKEGDESERGSLRTVTPSARSSVVRDDDKQSSAGSALPPPLRLSIRPSPSLPSSAPSPAPRATPDGFITEVVEKAGVSQNEATLIGSTTSSSNTPLDMGLASVETATTTTVAGVSHPVLAPTPPLTRIPTASAVSSTIEIPSRPSSATTRKPQTSSATAPKRMSPTPPVATVSKPVTTKPSSSGPQRSTQLQPQAAAATSGRIRRPLSATTINHRPTSASNPRQGKYTRQRGTSGTDADAQQAPVAPTVRIRRPSTARTRPEGTPATSNGQQRRHLSSTNPSSSLRASASGSRSGSRRVSIGSRSSSITRSISPANSTQSSALESWGGGTSRPTSAIGSPQSGPGVRLTKAQIALQRHNKAKVGDAAASRVSFIGTKTKKKMAEQDEAVRLARELFEKRIEQGNRVACNTIGMWFKKNLQGRILRREMQRAAQAQRAQQAREARRERVLLRFRGVVNRVIWMAKSGYWRDKATKIQALWRGHQERHTIKSLKKLRRAVDCSRRLFIPPAEKQFYAATQIQKIWRSYAVRKVTLVHEYVAVSRNHKACRIQHAFRSKKYHEERLALHESVERKQHNAAARVQRQWRRYLRLRDEKVRNFQEKFFPEHLANVHMWRQQEKYRDP